MLTNRRLPAVVLIVALTVGAALTFTILRLESRAAAARFDRMADLVAGRLHERINQHIALLQATAASFESTNGTVDAGTFARYVAGLGLRDDYSGIQGIGFARLVTAQAAPQAIPAEVAANYGARVTLHPPTDQPVAGAIVLLEPQDDRNAAALGYDMFSGPVRRLAMTEAARTGSPQASGPVQLVQEITDAKQTGFLVYIAVRAGAPGTAPAPFAQVAGFVYAPFRAGDLHAAAVRDGEVPLPVTLRTVDLAAPDTPLFDDAAGASAVNPRQVVRTLDVAGRQWQVTVTEAAGFARQYDHVATAFVGALSLLLALATAALVRVNARAIAAARHSARLAADMAEDRNLMLQEMKHRIKNHIARIQAIARHTRRGAADLDDFDKVFSARLSAMASTQDLLTRDRYGTANLQDLIRREIEQVMLAEQAARVMDGPVVQLDARQAQSVGLVIHELATNAMKYGQTTDGIPEMLIVWRIIDRAGREWLELDWIESKATAPADPSRGGFGTQLMEAMVEGDLNGRITRDFGPQGMHVTIAFPLVSDMTA
ncbi:CHASE domain-containing protein [Paracoccus luteus]|uniref:CHASE domain-containing protein n=1 Tax=Paracoccus luteus TaxID=2508543 RepID=UPI0010703069|nr:CHASE domain-containing protein [Paracoccus luteus]